MLSPGAYEHRQSLQNRLTSLRVVAAVVFVALLVSFWLVQVVQNARYEELADSNYLRTIPLPAPRGGQFVVVRMTPPAPRAPLLRSYSISDGATPGRYRFSVKRGSGEGSRYLHDDVRTGDRFAISAPRGLNERIYHEWRLNGRLIDKVPLDIRGGRKEGYRAWTHKMNFPPNAIGRWQIRVVTEADQQIGVLRFRVLGNKPAPEN